MQKHLEFLLLCAAVGCTGGTADTHLVVNQNPSHTPGQPTHIELSGRCPSNIAAAGSTCDGSVAVCEYSDDPREPCRPSLLCSGNVWTAQQSSCPALVNAPGCPATLAQAQQVSTCDPNAASICAYDGVACNCSATCNFGAAKTLRAAAARTEVVCSTTSYVWECDSLGPSPDATCPAALPVLGSVCSGDGLCVYGNACGSPMISCTDSLWQTNGGTVCGL